MIIQGCHHNYSYCNCFIPTIVMLELIEEPVLVRALGKEGVERCEGRPARKSSCL